MGRETIHDQGATQSSPARGHDHTLWLLVVLYALAVFWGLRNVFYWVPSSIDFLFDWAFALLLSSWGVVDARRRRHPIPFFTQAWFFLGALIFVPGYVVWSRRWRGFGWVLFHFAMWSMISTVMMNISGLILFRGAWLRAMFEV